MRILIIDDNDKIGDLLGKIVAEEGYKFHVIKSASTLVDHYEYYCPDVIILDIFMPEIDGFEVMRFLKQRQCNNVRIILISGDLEFCNMARDMGKVMGLRIAGTIHKPFRNDDLRALLSDVNNECHHGYFSTHQAERA